jgi:hypothetical protein
MSCLLEAEAGLDTIDAPCGILKIPFSKVPGCAITSWLTMPRQKIARYFENLSMAYCYY